MKKLLLVCLLLTSGISFAQLNIGYVDSKTIMLKLPDAQDAQKRIDAFINEWQTEIRKMEEELELKKKNFDERKLLMSEQKAAESRKEIADIEKKISDYRQSKFGVTGELFIKQEELMKPVNNMVFGAIQEVAEEEDLDFVFDRSGDILFLYAKEEYDITNLVLEKLL